MFEIMSFKEYVYNKLDKKIRQYVYLMLRKKSVIIICLLYVGRN